ncbi:hypothetical protein C0Q70_20433 [Pomacea canaliculata]|uniref:Uncharacterized protein n=1 Tax=Pomacea canaliculata TaxID=400727 RepID=A0A2T7NFI2_POMCA|nr:hypothetical protein C0Q70_20433 [Pomacea canaliculata]
MEVSSDDFDDNMQCETGRVIWRKSSDPNPLTIGRKTFVDDTRVMVEHIPLTPDWPLLIKQSIAQFRTKSSSRQQLSSWQTK